ncbi:MAG TPA: nucleoside monophosphate kinase [Acidimicrobiia bacterium]|nr:nucleoside monophosphate kinase [Acidimicrobiia bacterium]
MDRPVRRIAVIGPPGPCRRPHARRLGRALEVPVLSVGSLLEHEARQGSRAGLVAAGALERGELVPDEIVYALLEPRLATMRRGWILDGFPRTPAQARWMLATPVATPDTVIDVDVPIATLLASLDRESDADLYLAHLGVLVANTAAMLDELEPRVRVRTIDGAQLSPELALDLLHAMA